MCVGTLPGGPSASGGSERQVGHGPDGRPERPPGLPPSIASVVSPSPYSVLPFVAERPPENACTAMERYIGICYRPRGPEACTASHIPPHPPPSLSGLFSIAHDGVPRVSWIVFFGPGVSASVHHRKGAPQRYATGPVGYLSLSPRAWPPSCALITVIMV